MKRFDRKFGADFVRKLPETPGVYLFKDEAGEVLYAGKAKNLRRRLASYRSASRRKAHRKMRVLVREAHALEIRLQDTEADALLLENQLIRELRPRFNIDGAFDFLYPAFGTGLHEGRVILCFTTEPEAYETTEATEATDTTEAKGATGAVDFTWHGSFRPRSRAREAFDSLVELLGWLGHLEPASRLPDAPRLRGSRLVALRRIPEEMLEEIRIFLDGKNADFLETLCEALLESQGARKSAAQIGEELRFLEDFYRHDITRLREARKAVGDKRSFIPRDERDGIFIRARSLASQTASATQI